MKVNYTDDFKDKPIIPSDSISSDNSMNKKAIVVYDSDSEEYTKEYLKDVDNYFKNFEGGAPYPDIFRYILSDHKEYIFKRSYRILENDPADYDITAHIKNMGNSDLKITKLEIEKDVKFTLDGKERTEKAILRFEDTYEKDILYTAQYEFAGRKFVKNYVKEEYKTTEPRRVNIFENTPFYKIVVEKKPVNDSLETIFGKLTSKKYEDINSKVYSDFRSVCQNFDEYINNEAYSNVKKADLARIFIESLKFDKEVTHELNIKLYNYLTLKTR
ncbi:hypothetical protein HDR59_00035 [bacterium]|nr:hypothetical protein [bacterium]